MDDGRNECSMRTKLSSMSLSNSSIRYYQSGHMWSASSARLMFIAYCLNEGGAATTVLECLIDNPPCCRCLKRGYEVRALCNFSDITIGDMHGLLIYWIHLAYNIKQIGRHSQVQAQNLSFSVYWAAYAYVNTYIHSSTCVWTYWQSCLSKARTIIEWQTQVFLAHSV